VKSGKKRLGDILMEAGKITNEQLQKGLELQKSEGIALGKALEQLGFISQEEIILALSNQLGIPYISLLEEASEKLMKVLDIDKLLEYILTIAKQGLNAERGTLYIIDKENSSAWSKILYDTNELRHTIPITEGIAEQTASSGETINIKNVKRDERYNKFEHDTHDISETKTILSMPVKNAENQITGVLVIKNKIDDTFNRDDEEFLKSLTNYTATALELSELHAQLVHQKRIEHELSLAREIQKSLLPQKIPAIDGYEIFGVNKSCHEVSGDYYDFFPVENDNWVFAIGDVSGKGIPASLLMAVLQSHLKAINYMHYPINEIIKLLNEYLVVNSIPDHYVTFFLGILDCRNDTFEYVNAGHNPPFLINKGRQKKRLNTGGPIIGMFSNLVYSMEKIHLKKDDLLFCFTDGVTEYADKNNREYGETRLKKFLKENHKQTSEEIFRSLLKTLDDFSGNEKPKDDITVLMLRKKH